MRALTFLAFLLLLVAIHVLLLAEAIFLFIARVVLPSSTIPSRRDGILLQVGDEGEGVIMMK